MINPTQRADALTQDEMNYETNESAAAGLRDVSAARVRGEGVFFSSRYSILVISQRSFDKSAVLPMLLLLTVVIKQHHLA